MVGVADGEGVGQREVERDVLSREVRHRGGRLGRDPLVVAALVERPVAALPVVVEVLDEGQPQVVVLDLGPERQHVLALAVGLVPHRLAAGQRHRPGITEAPYAAQRSEVMVKGTIFLHQHDDVLDVLDGACAAVGGNGGGTGDALRQRGERGGPAGELQEPPPVEFWHG